MHSLGSDLRYALRSLRKTPAFTVGTALTLALGIAANTAVFSVVHGVVLRPLSFESPDRLVALWELVPDDGGTPRKFRVTAGNYLDWREQSTVFEDMAIFGATGFNWTSEGEPEQLLGAIVSASYFAVLGVEPVVGRVFLPEENLPGANRVVLLGHALWQRRFGGAQDVVGAILTLDGEPHEVVGVLPEGVYPTWPQATGRMSFLPAYQEIWVPMALSEERREDRRSHVFGVLARLRDEATLDEARAEMDTIARRLEAAFPTANEGERVLVQPFLDEIVGGVRPALVVLLGAVGVVLLIASANVAGLLLARSSARRRELAVRSAMGAGRAVLARQLLCESFLLSLGGGALGVGLAALGTDALVLLSPHRIPRLTEAGLDLPVVLFALGASVLTGALFGLLPALRASRVDLQRDLKAGARATDDASLATGTSGLGLRRLLVVAEVSMAVVLVVGAGLLVQSFWRLSRIDPGFRARNVLVAELVLPGTEYDDWGSISRFHQALLERLGALPSVRAASVAYDHPLESSWIDSFRILGSADASESFAATFRIVGERYFETMGIDVLRGRSFTSLDDPDHPGAVIVNESFARRYFPDDDPLGRSLLTSTPSNFWGDPIPEAFEIVGVVRDVKFLGPAADPEPAFYVPARQFPLWTMLVIARTDGDPLALAARVREEVWSLDPNLPVESVTTMESHLDEALAQPRFNAMLLSVFGAAALTLAAMGVYGLLTFSVSQRTNEIGLRMALGAPTSDVVRRIVGQGTRLTLIGVVIGLIASLTVTRVMASLLFEVSAVDPLTFAAAPAFLTAVALAAAYIPARRATRIDPIQALRYE